MRAVPFLSHTGAGPLALDLHAVGCETHDVKTHGVRAHNPTHSLRSVSTPMLDLVSKAVFHYYTCPL